MPHDPTPENRDGDLRRRLADQEADLGTASLPPAEMFADEQRQYAQESKLYGGQWIARRTDGSVITATAIFEDLHEQVVAETGDEATTYTPERIFARDEFLPPVPRAT